MVIKSDMKIFITWILLEISLLQLQFSFHFIRWNWYHKFVTWCPIDMNLPLFNKKTSTNFNTCLKKKNFQWKDNVIPVINVITTDRQLFFSFISFFSFIYLFLHNFTWRKTKNIYTNVWQAVKGSALIKTLVDLTTV